MNFLAVAADKKQELNCQNNNNKHPPDTHTQAIRL